MTAHRIRTSEAGTRRPSQLAQLRQLLAGHRWVRTDKLVLGMQGVFTSPEASYRRLVTAHRRHPHHWLPPADQQGVWLGMRRIVQLWAVQDLACEWRIEPDGETAYRMPRKIASRADGLRVIHQLAAEDEEGVFKRRAVLRTCKASPCGPLPPHLFHYIIRDLRRCGRVVRVGKVIPGLYQLTQPRRRRGRAQAAREQRSQVA